jgi:hypothetical protein
MRKSASTPTVGRLQYASDFWQFGQVMAIDGDQMLIWRPDSERWKPIANAVKVVSRRGVERRRTA